MGVSSKSEMKKKVPPKPPVEEDDIIRPGQKVQGVKKNAPKMSKKMKRRREKNAEKEGEYKERTATRVVRKLQKDIVNFTNTTYKH